MSSSPCRCWNCLKPSATMSCGACRVARYCSPACQKADWKNTVSGHKIDCVEWAQCFSATDGMRLYEVTLLPFSSEDAAAEARSVAEVLSKPAQAHVKNHLISSLFEKKAVVSSLFCLEATWLAELLKIDMQYVSTGVPATHVRVSMSGGRFVAGGPFSRLPDSNMALLSFVNRSNNQVFTFRVKNLLATPNMFITLLEYGRFLALVEKNHEAASQFWRFLGTAVFHPVCATTALLALNKDQQTAENKATRILVELMSSDSIADNLQGLVYQVLVLLEMHCESEAVCGLDKEQVISRVVPASGELTTLYAASKHVVGMFAATHKSTA